MKTYLINLAKNIFLYFNISISRTTEKYKILDLLCSIRAIQTNHDLIRLGSAHDGGYLIPNDLEGIRACFSPGVSEVADFENDLTKLGIKCFLADYSVDQTPIHNSLFDFQKKYLGIVNDDIYMTLEDWIQDKAPIDNNLLLQMDIEGAEYKVILNTPLEILKKFRIIVVEFHGLDNVFNRMGYETINLTFNKLLKDFEVVHVHPNNYQKPINVDGLSIPPAMEFTFLRKERISSRKNYLDFPHYLDSPNNPHISDAPLPNCWR
jgi:hypothetical protein